MATNGTINYIPNDPGAVVPIRGEPAFDDPAPGFDITPRPAAPAPAQFGRGTADFQYWQTRQALIYGLRCLAALSGGPLKRWQGDRDVLPVANRAGQGLNAYYNRMRISLFFA